MKSIHSLAIACVAIGSLFAAPAVAAQPSAIEAPTDAAATQTAFVATPVDADTLSSFRGGAAVSNDVAMAGVTAENTARNVSTGTNAIGGGAFDNMTGIPIVIQNSGANVLIQNALILNLQMN
jgi:hypothetical protein